MSVLGLLAYVAFIFGLFTGLFSLGAWLYVKIVTYLK